MVVYRFLSVFAIVPALGVASGVSDNALRFEPNAGQTDSDVSFLSRSSGATIFIKSSSLAIRTGGSVWKMDFTGGKAGIQGLGLGPLEGKTNYLTGGREQWRPGLQLFTRVQYRNVYPGVDLIYQGEQKVLRSSIVVHPGADPSQVMLHFEGSKPIRCDADGNIAVETDEDRLTYASPEAYQTRHGATLKVEAQFIVVGPNEAKFRLGRRNLADTLVVTYSTYLGGSGEDDATAVAVDSAGNTYVAGWTESTDFPEVTRTRLGNPNGVDAYVAKLNPAGQVVYITYLGGSSQDQAFGVTVDSSGSAIVVGATYSSNFPVLNAVRSFLAGGRNCFVAKLNAAGNGLMFSTYWGGAGSDSANAVAVDSQNNIYVAGETTSSNFPVLNPIQSRNGGSDDAFVSKFSASGAPVYSTYLGGLANDRATAIAVDIYGYAYITGSTYSTNFPVISALQSTIGGGQDAFAAKIGLAGNSVIYSTYIGGSGGSAGFPETGNGIAVDSTGAAYIAGATSSANFPTVNPFQSSLDGSEDAFVLKLNASGNAVVYSTYLGGSSIDIGNAIAIDASGDAYVAGFTSSADFPIASAMQGSNAGGYDAFIVELSAAGVTLDIGTYWGGVGSDSANCIALDPSGNIHIAGQTLSMNFPSAAAIQLNPLSPASAFVSEIPNPSFVNLALGKATSESSIYASSALAVDGNTDGNFFDGSVSHTGLDANAWWEVDLGSPASIKSLTIWNRADCCGSRLTNYWVFISNTPFAATDTPATLQGAAGVWSSFQATMPNPTATIAVNGVLGRYVRIQLAGANYLALAEVQVYGTRLTNVALGKATSESSIYASSALAVDGNTDGSFFNGSVSHTGLDANAWWEVDLGSPANINSVMIWNRTDCCGNRLTNYWVFISNTPFAATDTPATLQGAAGVWSSLQAAMPNPTASIAVNGVLGRYVRIQLAGANYLALAEVQVYAQ